MDIKWGGSGIEKVVFDFILENIPEGSTIVELGAGHVSTREFANHYDCYSVEDNPDFIGHYKVKYINAPIVNDWYDINILKNSLPSKESQKLIFIDGNRRDQILNHLDLFNPDAMYLIHDTYREGMQILAKKIGERLGRDAIFYTNGDFWAVI